MCHDKIKAIVHYRWRQILLFSNENFYIYDFNFRKLSKFGRLQDKYPDLVDYDFLVFANSYYLYIFKVNIQLMLVKHLM